MALDLTALRCRRPRRFVVGKRPDVSLNLGAVLSARPRAVLYRVTILLTMVFLSSCATMCDSLRDAGKCEADIRSELGADVAVGSGTIWYKGHGNYTTVYVHLRIRTVDSETLRSKITAVVRRDFRIPVDRVVFQ